LNVRNLEAKGDHDKNAGKGRLSKPRAHLLGHLSFRLSTFLPLRALSFFTLKSNSASAVESIMIAGRRLENISVAKGPTDLVES
jgi:hypothetical protein